MRGSSALGGWGVDDHNVASLPKANKLVRDKIPSIIRAKGRTPKTHIATASEYRSRLSQKLVEKAMEYAQSKDPEELADILEVVRSLCSVHKITSARLEAMRKKKAAERGTFSRRIILDE